MASGGKRGSANLTCQPFRLRFGGKLDPILLKAVDDVSMFRDGGTDLSSYKRGLPPLSPHTPLEGLSLYTLL